MFLTILINIRLYIKTFINIIRFIYTYTHILLNEDTDIYISLYICVYMHICILMKVRFLGYHSIKMLIDMIICQNPPFLLYDAGAFEGGLV